MLLNDSERKKLFAKQVPVSVKDMYTNLTRTSNLFFTMEWQDACAGMYNRKVLVITLTDNNDPFFLHNLHLSEDDFQMLKASQDLLIDYSSFPQHIIDYIENCLLEEKSPTPKFLLIFTINDKHGSMASQSQFDIVETNQFKHLTHLSLKFAAATDSEVRQYLASCFRHLKEVKRKLENDLAFSLQDSKDKLAACQQRSASTIQELELANKELNVRLTMKDSKHARELQEEREQLLARHKEELSRLENEKKEKEYSLRKDIQQLESRVTVLDTLNKEVQDKNYKHESTIRELRSKVASLEDEKKRAKDNFLNCKKKCEALQSEVKEWQSHMRRQAETITDLEQKLQSKEQSIAKLIEDLESEKEMKNSIEEELENVQSKLELSERMKKVLENDKEKLKKMLVDTQEKTKEVAKEEKSKGQQLAKYKKIVEEKEMALLDLKKEIAEFNISLGNKEYEIKSLTDSTVSLQKKIDSLEKELKERDDIIKWLNRHLTDNGIVPQYVPPSDLWTSPSSIAQKQLAKINSSNFEKSPPLATSKNTVPKSVRIETGSPVHPKNKSTPSPYNRHETVDSAYATFPSSCNQATPDDVQQSYNRNFDQTNFEIDTDALSAAFGNGDHVLKHSTAKKPSKSTKSTTPKVVKKR